MAQNWNSTYEATPADADNPQSGDDEIRNTRTGVSERGGLEHFWLPGDSTTTAGGATGHGWHREGSAKGYYQALAPTTRPDAVQALDTNDEGRMWVDSDTLGLHMWNGTVWKSINRVYIRWSVEGTLAVANNIVPQIVFPRPGTISKITVRSDTAPTGSSIIIDVNKNGSTSIFDTADDRVTIAASAKTGSSTGIHATNGVLVGGGHLTVDIDQIGSTIAGANLTMTIEYLQD